MSLTNLPNELILLIAESLDQRDINALAQTSHLFYELVMPYLYIHNIRYGNCSALFHAAYHGHHWLAVEMFEAGANMQDFADYDGIFLGEVSPTLAMKHNVHPQWLAAVGGHADVLGLLLDTGGQDTCTQGRLNRLLHKTVVLGKVETARVLLGRDVQIDDGLVNLHGLVNCAAATGNREMVRLLVHTMKRRGQPFLDQCGHSCFTAAYHGHYSMVTTFLELGVSARYKEQGGSLLSAAIKGEHRATIQLLMRKGAKLTKNAPRNSRTGLVLDHLLYKRCEYCIRTGWS